MKLTKIELENYRGYKKETIEFTNGLNTFIGDGASGKSSILKAIKFVIENDQSGKNPSTWILDKKDKIKKGEHCAVTLYTDTGHKIKRERTSSKNMYVIDNKEPLFNFGKSGIPEEVKEIFNINDVNLQSQFEPHFLISEKPGQIAKTLNKMVNLEIIDKSISNIKSIVREIKRDKENSDNNLKKYEEELTKFQFLDTMEKDINILGDIIEKKTFFEKKNKDLTTKKNSIQEYNKSISEIEKVSRNKKVVDSILACYLNMESNKEKRENLIESQKNIQKYKNKLNDVFILIEEKDNVNDLLSLFEKRSLLIKEYNEMLTHIENIEEYSKRLKRHKDNSSNIILCDHIISLYTKADNLNNMKKDIEESFFNIQKYNDKIKSLKKNVQENSEKIIGQECPTCGQEIKDIGGIC